MKCNTNRQQNEKTFVFMIGDSDNGIACKIHLPMRFKKHFDALKISDVPKSSDEFNPNKPITENNAAALKKFSEIVFEMTAEQIDDFTRLCIDRYPTTISDLLLIAAEAAGYKSLHASDYYSLARGFVSYMQMAEPSADVSKTEEDDFEEFGRFIVNRTGGFFFKDSFYYN